MMPEIQELHVGFPRWGMAMAWIRAQPLGSGSRLASWLDADLAFGMTSSLISISSGDIWLHPCWASNACYPWHFPWIPTELIPTILEPWHMSGRQESLAWHMLVGYGALIPLCCCIRPERIVIPPFESSAPWPPLEQHLTLVRALMHNSGHRSIGKDSLVYWSSRIRSTGSGSKDGINSKDGILVHAAFPVMMNDPF